MAVPWDLGETSTIHKRPQITEGECQAETYINWFGRLSSPKEQSVHRQGYHNNCCIEFEKSPVLRQSTLNELGSHQIQKSTS